MANKRISELTSITGANLADADLLVVVDVSDTTMASSGTNKKITMSELAKDSALTDNLIAKTTLTTDGDVLTRAAGVPARITRADLAQDSAFSSRYKPLASDTIWIPAPQMSATQGSPSLGSPAGLTYWHAWRLDADAAVETVAGSFVVPGGWATANVDLYWFNHGAGSGDVRLAMSYRVDMTAGSNLNSNVTDSVAQTVTAGLQNILVVTRLVTGWTLPTAGRVTNVAPYRLGSHAADTLANDIGVLGVLLTRAS